MRNLVLALLMALSAPALAQSWQLPVSELRGMSVAMPHGGASGTVAAVLLDVRPRGVHYAIVKVRQRDGAAKRFAYPLNALHPAPDTVLFNTPPETLHVAPGFDARTVPGGERYIPAANLLGSPVEDRLGNRVGRIADLVASVRTGGTASVLVDFDDGQTLSLPAHAVHLEPRGGAVVVTDSSRRA